MHTIELDVHEEVRGPMIYCPVLLKGPVFQLWRLVLDSSATGRLYSTRPKKNGRRLNQPWNRRIKAFYERVESFANLTHSNWFSQCWPNRSPSPCRQCSQYQQLLVLSGGGPDDSFLCGNISPRERRRA